MPPPAQPPARPQTLRVQPTPKKGFYQTLGDALHDASMNTIISIAAGTYMEQDLLLSKPGLVLQAEGDGVPVITSHGTTVQITSSVQISGVRIATEDTMSAAVLVAAGQPKFMKCTLQSVHVDMDAEPLIENCQITGSTHNGLFISGSSGGAYRDNVIKNHEGYGVFINSGGSPLLVNNQISQTLLGPVVVCGPKSTPTLKINNIQDTSMIPAAHDTRRSSAADEGGAAGGANTLAGSVSGDFVAAPASKRASVVITNGACPTLDGNVIFSGISTGVIVASDWEVAASVPQGAQKAAVERIGTPREAKPVGAVRRRGPQMVSHAPVPPAGGKGAAASGRGGGGASPAAAKLAPPARPPPVGGLVTMVRNMIRDNAGAGLRCRGATVRVACDSNTFDSNAGEGARAHLGASLTCQNDSFRSHMKAPTISAADPSTTIVLNGCTIVDGPEGCVATEFANCRAAGVTLEKFGTAVRAAHGAIVELDDCTVNDNDCAVSVETNAVLNAIHSEFRGNAIGVQALTRGQMNVSHSTLRRNKVAMQSLNGGAGTATSNIIMESDTVQILVSERGNTTFKENMIKDAACHAVHVRDFGMGRFIGNTFLAHKQWCVKIDSGGDPHFEDNAFNESALEHVVIERHGVGLFIGNRLSGCQRSAVLVRTGATPTFRGNTVISNALTAFELQDGAGGTYEKNNLRENAEYGVWIKGSATQRAQVVMNTIEMSRSGVEASDGARALVGRNVIQNCTVGVNALGANELAIARNEITQCATGVACSVSSACRPAIVFNRIHGNTTCGVSIANDSAPMLNGNVIMGHFGRDTGGVVIRGPASAKLLFNVFSMNDVGVLVRPDAALHHTQLIQNVFTDNKCGMDVQANFLGGLRAVSSSSTAAPPAPSPLMHASSSATFTASAATSGVIPPEGSTDDLHASSKDPKSSTNSGKAFPTPKVPDRMGPRCIRNTYLANHVGLSVRVDGYCSSAADSFIRNATVGVAVASATSSLQSTQCFFAANGRYNLLVCGDAGKGRSNADATAKATGGLRRSHAKQGTGPTSRYEPVVVHEAVLAGPASPSYVKNGREEVYLHRCTFLSNPLLLTTDSAPKINSCLFGVLPASGAAGNDGNTPAPTVSSGTTPSAANATLPGIVTSQDSAGAHERDGGSGTHASTSFAAIEMSNAATVPFAGHIDAALSLQTRTKGELSLCVFKGLPSSHTMLTASEGRGGGRRSTISGHASFVGSVLQQPGMNEAIACHKSTATISTAIVSGCFLSGIHVAPGFTGRIAEAHVFNNFGCGVRVTGRMASPAAIVDSKIFSHNAVADVVAPEPVPFGAAAVSAASAASPTGNAAAAGGGGGGVMWGKEPTVVPELPDVGDDDAFTGAESDTAARILETHFVPKYTMPASDGPGIGVVVGSSGSATMQRCEVFASGLANVITTSKTNSTMTNCVIHSSDGYGLVVRAQCHLTLKECRVSMNAYSGLLAESHAAPMLNSVAFDENGIGALQYGDDSEFSRCHFTSNRIAGVRIADGSHATYHDCVFNKNAVGVETRHNAATAPTLTHCNIYANVFCGVMASGSSRPTLTNCRLYENHGVCALVARCASTPTVKGCLFQDNAAGLITRLAAEPMVTECGFEENTVGVIAEWNGLGTILKCTFTGQKTQAALIRTEADPLLRQNIFHHDAPIVITTEGKGKLEANAFRNAKSCCVHVVRGGAPVISETLFSCVQLTDDAVERLRKEFETGVSEMDLSKSKANISGNFGESSMLGASLSSPTGGSGDLEIMSTAVFAPINQDAPITHTTHRRTEQVRKDRISAADLDGLQSQSGADGALIGLMDVSLEDPMIHRSEDDAFIPVKFEMGGQGELRHCVFVGNDPCSVLCDGATTEPVVEACVFYRHGKVGIAVCNGAQPKLRDTAFIQNWLGLQLGRTPLTLADCWFLSNTTAVEADAAVSGLATGCTFLDDNVSVNVLPGSGFSVRKCRFYRCDTGVIMGQGATGSLDECNVVEVTNTAFVIESGNDRCTKVTKCRVSRGGAGIELVNGGEAELTSCTFEGLEKHGVRLHNTMRSLVSGCTFAGNGVGVTVEGMQCVPDIVDSTIQFNRVGIEVHGGGNPTVNTCHLRQNRLGLYAHNDGLGMYKRLEIIGNATGVHFKSGVEGFPSLSHSNVLDSEECGVHVSNYAVGEVVDCHLFDNRVGVIAGGSASTLFDHTKVSTPENKAAGERFTVQKESTMVKLLLGPNFQIVYEHSPAYGQLTHRQRKLDSTKAKNANTAALEKCEHTDLKAERATRVDVQQLFARVGLDPILKNALPSMARDLLTPLDWRPVTGIAADGADGMAMSARGTSGQAKLGVADAGGGSRAATPGSRQMTPSAMAYQTRQEEAAIKRRRLVAPSTEGTGVRRLPADAAKAAANGTSGMVTLYPPSLGVDGDDDGESGEHADPMATSREKGKRGTPSKRGKSPSRGTKATKARAEEPPPSAGVAMTRVKRKPAVRHTASSVKGPGRRPSTLRKRGASFRSSTFAAPGGGSNTALKDGQPAASPLLDSSALDLEPSSPGIKVKRDDGEDGGGAGGEEKETTIPLLPPLPPLPTATKVYPRAPQASLQPNVPILPVLVPYPPPRVALTCFTNPQNGKFGYGSNLHRDTVYLAKAYNPLFADQVLFAFHTSDERRREMLSVLDVARFVRRLCEKHDYHPARFAAALKAKEAKERSALSGSMSSARGALTSAASDSMLMPQERPDTAQQETAKADGGSDIQKTMEGAIQIAVPVIDSDIPPVPDALKRADGDDDDVDDEQAAEALLMSLSHTFSSKPGTREGGKAHRAMTPIADIARDFTESAWLTIVDKPSLLDEITLRDFARIVADPGTSMAPVFKLHFTWLGRDVHEADAFDPKRRRRVVAAMAASSRR